MKDGLYQVKTSYLCAGFVIENGVVTMIAPILVKRFHYWKTIAVRIGDQISMKYEKEDIVHVSSMLKNRYQNLSANEMLEIVFDILSGLKCYKENIIPPANSISKDLVTPNSVRFPERD